MRACSRGDRAAAQMAGGLSDRVCALPRALPRAEVLGRLAGELLRALRDLLARVHEQPGVGLEGEHPVAGVVPLLGDLRCTAHDAGRHLMRYGGAGDLLDHLPMARIPTLVTRLEAGGHGQVVRANENRVDSRHGQDVVDYSDA